MLEEGRAGASARINEKSEGLRAIGPSIRR